MMIYIKIFFFCFFIPLLIILSLFLWFYTPIKSFQRPDDVMWPDISLSPDDRILILAPHPDDEIVGCGGVIQHAMKMKLPVHIAFLTNGDANEWSFWIYRHKPVLSPGDVIKMGVIRQGEAIKAAKMFGLNRENLTFLGYPDVGTAHIWCSHWNKSKPYKSILTRVTKVPYENSLRKGAPYKGEEILKDVKQVIGDFKPTKIFVSHPGDNNPDHRAFFLFNTIALWDLNSDIPVYPYLVHYPHWPFPKKYVPDKPLEPPISLEVPWQKLSMTPEEVELNVKSLKAHISQYEANTGYILSFIRKNELFGNIPLKSVSDKKELTLFSKENHLIPEELLEEEKQLFVGLEKQSVRIENGSIYITVSLSRPIGKTVGLSIYLFGYSKNKDFSIMPKLHIKFGILEYNIYDQDVRLSKSILQIKRDSKLITISLPLKELGEPEKILISAKTYLAEIPMDTAPWMIVECE